MSRPHYDTPPIAGDTRNPFSVEDKMLTAPWVERKKNTRVVGHTDLDGWGDTFQIRCGTASLTSPHRGPAGTTA